ncbi:MAG: SDR family NAD(P)-dependent oxidoreductase [Stenotrophobium sp.]
MKQRPLKGTMFRNKHIIITGGSSGLGLELAAMLAAEGARIALIARDSTKLAEVAGELRRQYPAAQIDVVSVDVRDEAAISETMRTLATKNDGIDMLINSAGILREGYFERLPMQDFRDVMEINYFGLLHATRAALPYLKKSSGRLINIASMAGLTGAFGYTPYCAAKHALVGLSESLRYELRPMGVAVHLVCPAEFDSPMVDELDRNRTPENRAHTLTIPKATVEQIAAGTLSGIRANRFLIVPGGLTRAAAYNICHFPGVSRMLGDRVVAKAYRGP